MWYTDSLLAQLYRTVSRLGTAPPPVIKESRAADAVAGSGGFGGYVDPPRNTREWQDLYTRLVTVYRCGKLNATTVASGDLRFYRETQGTKRQYLPIAHPLPRLLSNASLKFHGELSLWLAGNMYWELCRASEFGPVTEIVDDRMSIFHRGRREEHDLSWSLMRSDMHPDELRLWVQSTQAKMYMNFMMDKATTEEFGRRLAAAAEWEVAA